MFLCHKGGVVYILGRAAGCRKGHICSIHKLLVKSTFPRHFTQIQLKTPLRYPLRQNIEKSSISPLFTSSKIIKITFKITSNPYKLRLLSNSTENRIHNKETTRQNSSIYISSIIQITSKINTFQPYQIYKQYHSIEVTFFTSKFYIKNLYQTIQINTSVLNILNKQHSHPTFLTCNPYTKSLKIDSNFNQNHFNDKILT